MSMPPVSHMSIKENPEPQKNEIAKILEVSIKNSENIENQFSQLANRYSLEVLRDLTFNTFKKDKLHFSSVVELAQYMKDKHRMKSKPSLIKHVLTDLMSLASYALRFSLRIIDASIEFIEALNNQEKFRTLWDHSIRLNIMLKMLLIPDTLVKMLTPIISISTRVYLATAGVIVGVGFFLMFYIKYINPLPAHFKHLKRINIPSERVGQSAFLEEIKQGFLGNQRVVIVGLSGQGKTALVHRFIQAQKEKLFADQLNNLVPFELENEQLKKHNAFDQIVTDTSNQLVGHHKKMFVVINDMESLVTVPDSFRAVISCFFNENSPLAIVTTTPEGWEKMKELGGAPLLRRVHPIQLDEADDKQCLLMIKAMEREHRQICIQQCAIDALLHCSKDREYHPEIGRLAKIEKMLDLARGACLSSLDPKYVPPLLVQARENKRDLGDASNLDELERNFQVLQEHLNKVRAVLEERMQFISNFFSLTEKIAESRGRVDEFLEKKYYLYVLFGEHAFKSAMNELSRSLEPQIYTSQMSIQIDDRAITRAFEKLKKAATIGQSSAAAQAS